MQESLARRVYSTEITDKLFFGSLFDSGNKTIDYSLYQLFPYQWFKDFFSPALMGGLGISYTSWQRREVNPLIKLHSGSTRSPQKYIIYWLDRSVNWENIFLNLFSVYICSLCSSADASNLYKKLFIFICRLSCLIKSNLFQDLRPSAINHATSICSSHQETLYPNAVHATSVQRLQYLHVDHARKFTQVQAMQPRTMCILRCRNHAPACVGGVNNKVVHPLIRIVF